MVYTATLRHHDRRDAPFGFRLDVRIGHFLLSPYACTIIPNNNVWQNSLCNVRILPLPPDERRSVHVGTRVLTLLAFHSRPRRIISDELDTQSPHPGPSRLEAFSQHCQWVSRHRSPRRWSSRGGRP